MSTAMLRHTQKIRGFQHCKLEFSKEKTVWRIRRTEFRCPHCENLKLRKELIRLRQVQGLPCGNSLTFFEFKVRRLYCYGCNSNGMKQFHFLSAPKSWITKKLECRILMDRQELSIRSVATNSNALGTDRNGKNNRSFNYPAFDLSKNDEYGLNRRRGEALGLECQWA